MHRLVILKLTTFLIALTTFSSFAVAQTSRAMECKEIVAPSAGELASKLNENQDAAQQFAVRGIYFDTKTEQHTLVYCKWKV